MLNTLMDRSDVFYIYFHNDFDGMATAAIFSKFLMLEKNLSFEDIEFIPVDYEIKNNWVEKKIISPSAVLDFLYHPSADWWFDHHTTSFLNKAILVENYKRDKQKHWDTEFLSCPSLLISHFYRYYHKYSLELSKRYEELIYWSDIIDGAKYSTPKMLFDYNYQYINLNKTLAIDRTIDYRLKIIKAFYENDISQILNSVRFFDLLKEIKEKEKKAINIISNIIKIKDKVAYFDQSKYDIPFQRFLPYYLYPDLLYRIGIYKKDDMFSVSVNYNIWQKEKNTINLGKLCNSFGGGGRFDVGAVIAKNHNIAVSIADSLFRSLWLDTSW